MNNDLHKQFEDLQKRINEDRSRINRAFLTDRIVTRLGEMCGTLKDTQQLRKDLTAVLEKHGLKHIPK